MERSIVKFDQKTVEKKIERWQKYQKWHQSKVAEI